MLGERKGVVPEGQEKVAQYEVLGSRFRRKRPGRDDRWLLTLVKRHTRDQELNVSIVPYGTDISFCVISQSAAADTGLL